MYILATAVALIILSLIHPADSFATMGAANQAVGPADPINHVKYNPRPEWYFLFLFQLLKYFQGPWEIVGTAVIPGIATVILLGLPFYDRNWSRRAVRRPVAMGSMGLVLVLLAFLTYSPLSASTRGASSDYLSTVAVKPKYANIQAIFAKNCQPCHYNAPYSNNLNLTNYQGAITGGNGAGNLPKKVIVPGNAKGSYLWQVIEWVQKNGATMPLGKPQKIAQVDERDRRVDLLACPFAEALLAGAGFAPVVVHEVVLAPDDELDELHASLSAELVTAAAEGAGGYAREQSADQQVKIREALAKHLAEQDLVITTAQIPNRPAPKLLTAEMIRGMRSGSVIVDLAAESGGNCELTRAGETVRVQGVTILGPVNLPATLPTHASQMFSKNVLTLVQHLVKDGSLTLDPNDEITKAMLVTTVRDPVRA